VSEKQPVGAESAKVHQHHIANQQAPSQVYDQPISTRAQFVEPGFELADEDAG